MGLDGVEIVMKVEEAFGIAISDSEAEEVATPRQLIDLVLSKISRANDDVCLTQRAFHRVRASLMQRFKIHRNQIKPETPLSDLFPKSTRRKDVEWISAMLGLRKTVEFIRPDWLTWLIIIGVLGSLVGVAGFLVWHPVISKNFTSSLFLGSLPLAAGILMAFVVGKVATVVTDSMRIEFQSSMSNVGYFSKWIVANSPEAVKAKPGHWSREQVAEVIREIVTDVLPCENDYREDAHFVKDLGMG